MRAQRMLFFTVAMTLLAACDGASEPPRPELRASAPAGSQAQGSSQSSPAFGATTTSATSSAQ